MSLSRGSVNIDELREATYKRPNSPIFAPFMINVVCNLLNNSDLMQYQSSLNICDWIGLWGGGLKLLKHCFPLWDKCVSDTCKIAHIDHIIWKKYLNYHNISNIETLNNISVLQTLLEYWRKTGEQNNTYGPYPTPFEQQEFQNIVIIPMGYLTQAIADLKFEPCFKKNNSDIETFITQQRKHQKQQQQQLMDEDGKDEYKENNNFNPDPFNYNSNKPWNWNFNNNQSQNFRGHGRNNDNNTNNNTNTNTNNNFDGFQEEKKEMMLNINRENGGIIYYQSAYYSIEQLQNICNYFMFNKENAPRLLFGDNNIDKNRPLHQNRLYFGGQAQELGKHDRWFGYGITTTLKQPMNEQSSYFQQTGQFAPKFDFDNFKNIMNNEFKLIIDHLANGRDIIIPAPNYQDLRENRQKYFDQYGQRKFRHNLGTGTADLQEKYLKYIQIKLNQLESYASSVQEIDHPKIYENKKSTNPKRRMTTNQQRTMQQPITITPRERQRQRQRRRDSNGLNLPFNNDRSGFTNHISPQRLNFDEKRDYNTNENKEDPYASIHYESPPHRPRQQRRNSNRNRNRYGQQNSSGQVERKSDYDGQVHQNQNQRQNSLLNTPPRNNNAGNRKYPHYKSPKRAVTKEEWQDLSSPDNMNGERYDVVRYNDNGRDNRVFDDSLKLSINWCLFILFYFPRKIYVALVIQNRPQDVFKFISVLLMGIGCISYLMNLYLSNMCLICFIGGIVCALCGGDQFYPERVMNKIPNGRNNNGGRYGQEWNYNGRIGNGYQNDVGSPFNYN